MYIHKVETNRRSHHSRLHRSRSFVFRIVRNVGSAMEILVNTVTSVRPYNATPICLGDRFSGGEMD